MITKECECCGAEWEADEQPELTQDQLTVMIAGMRQRYADAVEQDEAERLTKPLYCSFCGETDVDLVKGPSVYICELCNVAVIKAFREGETVRIQGDIK